MTALIIALVGFAIVILYQEYQIKTLETAFLSVLLNLHGVDVDGTRKPGSGST